MTDVRLAEFFNAVKTRIDVQEYRAVAGGAGRVFKVTEQYIPIIEQYPQNSPWLFSVILNVRTVWPQQDFDIRPVPFVIRTECNDYHAEGYDPAVQLERVQEIIKDRLHNWVPTGLTRVRAAFRVWRNVPPQAMPEWEEPDKRYWLSSEYRTEMVAAS